MLRILFLGLLTGILLLLGVTLLNGPMLGLAIPLAIYLLAGWWSGERIPLLEIQRTVSDERVVPGAAVTVSLRLRNRGPALHEVLLEDMGLLGIEMIEGSPRRRLTLPRGGEVTFSCTFRARRGYFPLHRVRLTTSDHLGLVPRVTYFPTEGQVFVLPLPVRLRRIEIRPRRTRIYSGSTPAREGGPGVEFFGVRDYETGDSLRWINWRLNARHPESLFSNEFEQERVADVGIILDARLATNLFGGDKSIFDYSASAAASLADAFLSTGNRVGLLIYGKYAQWTAPGYGRLQRERILQAIGRAEIGETQAFSELIVPRRLFPAYSQMVLVSPLQDDDADTLFKLRAMGYPVIVVAPDPVSYELRHLPDTSSTRLAARIVQLERRLMLRRVQHSGVQVINWDVEVPFEQVVSAALSRPPSYLRALTWGGVS
jgi:uncharacterized protein (DUF58 family)